MPAVSVARTGRFLRPLGVGALALLLAAGGGRATAAEEEFLDAIPGPVTARILKVRDGDTAEVLAFVWPGQTVRVAVRLHGIDAPEHRGKCDWEKRAAEAARKRLAELVAAAKGEVTLTAISGDKYFGRVLADMNAGGRDVARVLLAEGLVAPYDGKAKRDWCRSTETAETTRPAPAPAPPRRPAPAEPSPSGGVPGFPGYRG